MSAKISPEFLSRLDRLEPNQRVRAIVLLHSPDLGSAFSRRQLRAERQSRVDDMRRLAKTALIEIDEILSQFEGKRLVESPDSLGSILIEGTAAGIKAIAASTWVLAIMEDQPLYPTP